MAAALCWAFAAIVAAGAFERGVSPERLAQARVGVALVPLAAWLLIARRDLLAPPRAALPALLLFGASMAVVNFCYYLAISRMPVGVAISLQYTAPVLVLIGSAIVARRGPGSGALVAGVLTLIGAVLVSGALAGLQQIDSIGIAAGIGSAISFATYLIGAGTAGRKGSHPVTTLLAGFVVALVLWSVVLPIWTWPYELLADSDVLLRVLAVGLMGTLLPFFLAVSALRIISPALAGMAATSEPVFAATLAWVFLGQALGPLQVLGGALVVLGVLVAQATHRPAESAAAVEVAA